ncbi:hypothetical protein FOR87_16875 [Bacillus anthracis]|nr:hypothetical protein [Bacillus anthracis]MDR4389697.1 hypothetical protein [Bacillus anthracis]
MVRTVLSFILERKCLHLVGKSNHEERSRISLGAWKQKVTKVVKHKKEVLGVYRIPDTPFSYAE